MPGLSSVLVMVAVAAGTFGVLALLVSYIRYQRWLYEAEELADDVCSHDAASLLILDRLRRSRVGLIRINLPSPADRERADRLKANIRKTDTVWRMDSGELWVVLTLEPHHLPVVAARLRSLLQTEGADRGHMEFVYPDRTPESVQQSLKPDPAPLPESGWTQSPEHWPFKEEEVETSDSPVIDPLTRTLSPTRAPRAFRGILANYRRRNQPLSLLRVDVDHLREYNEGPGGREAGDAVLKEVAAVLMRTCREDDLVARLEEDEFLICIEKDTRTALLAAQRMSDAVKQSYVEHGDLRLRFTVSIGIAGFPEHGETPRALVTGAGWAREAASSRGRGNCLVLTPDMRPQPRTSTQAETSPDSF